MEFTVNQPNPVLSARQLTRRFRNTTTVNNVSFDIHPGQIVALVGPNGAGKTTTVKMCSTLLAPTSGTITVCGIDATQRRRQARQHISIILGGETGFYQHASVKDNLLFFADVAGVPSRSRRSRVKDALAQVRLTDRMFDPVGELSRGMKQRLHIARGLLSRPQVLLFDEPTNGLDPEISVEIRALIRAYYSHHTCSQRWQSCPTRSMCSLMGASSSPAGSPTSPNVPESPR